MGVDVHVLTINTGFFNYDLPADITTEIANDCNAALKEMMDAYPDRIIWVWRRCRSRTSPAIDMMASAMGEMGFKGITIGDHVNGVTLDDLGSTRSGPRSRSWGRGLLPPGALDRRRAPDPPVRPAPT